MEQIKQLLIAVLQKVNLWEQNAKSIDELPTAPNVIPLAKIHISDNGTSKALELQKLIDASLSSAVNQITSIGEITVSGNDVTVPIATWKIANVGYSTIAPTIINVPFSAAGTTRIDVLVANTSNQIVKISGNDTTSVAIRPNIPLNTVVVTEINVSESALAPVPFPLTPDEIAAIQNANGPSASNPFATLDDIITGSSSLFLGDFVSLEALQSAHPSPIAGNTANIIVEFGNNDLAVWDNDDSVWIVYPGAGYSFSTPSFDETASVNPVTTANIGVAGLTITNKINFVTSLITSLRNVSFPDKDGTVAYLDDISALLEGIAWKQPVELNLTSGVDDISPAVIGITSLTQQGVTLVDGSRVIVSGLTNQAKNGIYRVSASLTTGAGGYTYYRLFRTNDANTGAELNNAVVGVTSGTHAGKTYRQSTLNPIVTTSNVGGSNIIFTEFGNSTVANATNILAGIAKLYNSIGTETDGGITPNAVKVGLDSKANLTQVGNLLREEFTFSGSQTFTLANNYGQVYSVEVQGQGALSTSQYTLVAPNQITITDTLDSGDYIVVIYSNAITGIQPYYSQAEVDGLLALKSNSNQTPRTWKSGIDGATVANTLTITPTYTQLIPAGTFAAGDVIDFDFRAYNINVKTSVSILYIYVNTTNNLTTGSPLQVAQYNFSAAQRTGKIQRFMAVKGAKSRVVTTTGTQPNDDQQIGSMSTLTIDWTIDQYIIFAIGHTVADQTLTGDFYRITKN